MPPEFPSSLSHPQESLDSRKAKLNEQIERLLDKGLPIVRIVSMLGPNAEKHLTIKLGPGGKKTYHFNTAAFLESEAVSPSKLKIPENYAKYSEIILPPAKGDSLEQKKGSGRKRLEKDIPRIAFLTEIVSELDLPYSIVEEEGEKIKGYVAFLLPSVRKIIFANNESDNATFIIHDCEPEDWKDYAEKNKESLKNLGPQKVSVVNYPLREKVKGEEWKKIMKDVILSDPKEKTTEQKPEFPLASPNDRTIGGLAKELGLDNRTVSRLVETSAEELKEMEPLEQKRSSNGSIRKYLKPVLLETVRKAGEALKARPQAPEGWKTLMSIAQELNLDASTVSRIAGELMDKDLELVKETGEFANPTRRMALYFGPKVIGAIKEASLKREIAPEGWFTTRALAKKLNVDDKTIKNYTEICLIKLKESKEEHVKNFKSPDGNMRGYLSPTLSKAIQEEIEYKNKLKGENHFSQTIEQGSIHPDNSSREET